MGKNLNSKKMNKSDHAKMDAAASAARKFSIGAAGAVIVLTGKKLWGIAKNVITKV